LAAIDGATRAAVEAHLVGCGRCVGAYLTLKRAVDAGEEALAPSELLRARVRAAAASQLAPKRRAWIVAATATAAAIVTALFVARPAPLRPRAPSPRPPQMHAPTTVDTARSIPENMSYL
jgi:hypothetical protein